MNHDTHTYQLLPSLSDEDYARLKADIAERGVLVPIEVDEHGNVLDGHHRKQIADELGIDCPSITRIGLPEYEKRLHAVSLNLARRHLTDAQKVGLGMLIEPDVAARAAARMEAGKAAERTTPMLPDPKDNSPEGQTRDAVAEQVGIGSGRTYDRAKKTLQEAERVAPEVARRAMAGTATMKDVRKAVNQVKKAEKVAAIAARPVDPLHGGPWPVIYADPPWRYDDAEPTRAIENHYPTMTAEDICALTPPAADDAVLFLWATSPKLVEAMAVMDAWGFTYRTCMVWVKDRIGMGYYARQRHELLLIGRRGELPVPDPANRPDSVIESPLGRHSAKPDEFATTIERMYPTLPKVEMFCRSPRPGWDVWGNEAAA